MNPSPYCTLHANHNAWMNQTVDAVLYNTNEWGVWEWPIKVIDNYPLADYQYNSYFCTEEEYNPNDDWWKNISFSVYIPEDYDFPVITTDDFNNVALNDALEICMTDMYNDTVAGYLHAADKLSQILAYNYQSIDTVVQEFLDLAYFKMLESVGSALLTGQAEIDSNNNYPAEFQSVIDVTTALGDSITITDTATYLRKFMYTYDLASLWRTFRQYDFTAAIVLDLLEWAGEEEYAQAEHLLCLATIEQQIKDSNYGPKQIDSLLNYVCPYNYFPEETVPFIVLSNKNNENNQNARYGNQLIFNNPVNKTLYLNLMLKTGETAIIRIYYNQGKLVASYTTKDANSFFDVENFKKGLYLMHVSTNSKQFEGKFVKE